MIAVTGSRGFIGGAIVGPLRARTAEVLGVDRNLCERRPGGVTTVRPRCELEMEDFLDGLDAGRHNGLVAIVHQAACVDTGETDRAKMRVANVDLSRRLMRAAVARRVPFVYASSAAVYGQSHGSKEDAGNEHPLNEYARSKAAFDREVRALLAEQPDAQVVGLRYFNVYGPNEAHKGRMASMVCQSFQQLAAGRAVRLFGAGGGFGPGEQRRDFVYVEDVARVVLWCLAARPPSGVYNVGTGRSRTFNEVATQVAIAMGLSPRIEYVPMPASLERAYQWQTCADLQKLRSIGCPVTFRTLEEALPSYLPSIARGQ